jgi:hypothetical protein
MDVEFEPPGTLSNNPARRQQHIDMVLNAAAPVGAVRAVIVYVPHTNPNVFALD